MSRRTEEAAQAAAREAARLARQAKAGDGPRGWVDPREHLAGDLKAVANDEARRLRRRKIGRASRRAQRRRAH